MNDSSNNISNFIDTLEQSTNSGVFIKLTLSNKRVPSSDLNNVFAKPVMIKDRLMLSFTYRHTTKDITRNFELKDATIEVSRLLEENFTQGFLATTENDYQFLINKKGNSTLLKKQASITKAPALQHDKLKQRLVNTENNSYLVALGVISQDGKIKPDMQDKFRQINKYVEIVDGIIKDVTLPDKVHVADMGAGKGYLTFAMYDYLTTRMKKQVEMTGIELRKELVDQSNVIAQSVGYEGLNFKEGTIETAELPAVDVLIALHACDTATDEAIYRGIKGGAEVIVCSPCCHKQVRREMQTDGLLSEITQYGILAERQAEILTDTIRALILEAYGYRTNIAEFIASEHTPKNLIISAVKKKSSQAKKQLIPDPVIINKINSLKKEFQIGSHYLQELMNK
jgi:protein-L-isoaspartate O-methyltransferase